MDASGPAPSDYDVFLSFRGSDTRHGIVDHLYESMTNQGIRVFKDDEEMRCGEEIGGELERSIRGSRIYVVVFSKNFASSKWCLRELAMIMGFHGDLAAGKIILPIFYDVHPNDVKLQTKLYQNSLDEHRGKYREEVDRWEEDLVKVGQICGWDYEDHMGEGQFVKRVVQDVLRKLNIRDRDLPQHLVGINDRVVDVVKMLYCDSPEVRVVILHGMGGIGKTTLANVIFNRICSQFDGCSYLADVRVSSAAAGGIVKLRNKLLRDILGSPVTEIGDSNNGVKQIKKWLGGKKVLVIFDDVSESSQLDQLIGNGGFFGLGTRIIVTTRDRSVYQGLTGHRAVCIYEMEEMSEDHALQLFNMHAFGVERSPDDFAALSEQVVRTSRNLPLALEVVGRHLRGAKKDVWEYTLETLKQVPHKDVMKTLLISYEGLEEREKQIFLDIACFSDDLIPRRYASYMWEACGLLPNWGVAVLVNKLLVKDLNDDKFGMHDLIRDMGREIVCLQGLDCLGMRSRLLNPVDAMKVVRQKEGKDKVLAMDLGFLYDEHHLACEEFEAMSNLRFLRLCGGQLIGDFRNFRTKLLWLNWENCERVPNPSFFNMNNLVVLMISGSGITDESMNDLRMGNLRALEIWFSPMTRMPDLSQCSKLERISLHFCDSLETLHSSVGKLGYLMSLNILCCESLRSLPEEFGSAKALQELSLIECYSIEELPESIGRLGALRLLRVRYTKIRKIPASIGNLKCLEVLEFGCCTLDEDIPEEIGGLSSLEILDPNECDLCQLPGTIHQLSRLHSLSLEFFGELRELPKLPSSLTKLIVENCFNLVRLPDLSCMRKLSFLRLSRCEKLVDISGIEGMVMLEELIITNCNSLIGIPDLSGLTRLTRMTISYCHSLQRLPRVNHKCDLHIMSYESFYPFFLFI